MIQKIIWSFRIIKEGYKNYTKHFLYLALLGFFSGILEGVGINAIIPLFSFASGGGSTSDDAISKAIEKFFSLLNLPFSLRYLLIFIVGLFIVKAAVMMVFNFISVRITATYEKQTRDDIFSSTLLARWPYLLKQKIGYLEQVIITDVSRGAALLRHLVGSILLTTNIIIYVIIALNISFLVTMLTIATGILLFYLFRTLFVRAAQIAAEQANLNKKVSNLVNEHMIGIKTVKASSNEIDVLKKARNYFEKLRETSVKVSLLSNFNHSIIEPIGIIFIVGLFSFSYKLPGFNFASFAVIIYLIQKIFSFIQIGQNRIQTIAEQIPYLSTILEYQRDSRKNYEKNLTGRPFSFKDSLRFDNLFFAYKKEKEILKGLNLTVKKGEFVGLIGPSGAGKTTIVDLFLRFFEPQKGEIQLDGHDIKETDLKSWRHSIGYVSQDIFLLNDTVENNIKFYKNLSDSEMIAAAKLANIHDFIMEQKEGYKTLVGERGTLLSGGQRQRVILARVLARKPEILILDEATSSLDNESELLIQKAIEGLKGKVTVVAIAHRLSTITNSDRLAVISDGRIVEEGSPKQLLQNTGSYFHKVFNILEHEH